MAAKLIQYNVEARSALKSGVDLVKIRTDEDYVKPLIGLFKRRSARK